MVETSGRATEEGSLFQDGQTCNRCRTEPRMESGIPQPPVRGFMDDLTITTSTHVQARWILKALDDMATWARMKFKPKKSRSTVIRSGKVTGKFQLQVQGEVITID